MNAKQLKSLVQPEGQDRNVFNGFKRALKDLGQLTDEQLAILSFETWDEAHKRAGRPAIEPASE